MTVVDLDRLHSAMSDANMDQSALARAIGCTPGAINQVFSGRTRKSRLLPEIARELDVDLFWLLGEVDDPKGGSPRPRARIAPAVQHVMMAVALPPERALTRMFTGLLKGLDRSASLDEQARLLAKRLPIGLSQLRDLAPEPMMARAERLDEAGDPAVRATREREPIR